MRILVADDNDDVRGMICVALAGEGVDIVAVGRGSEALLHYHMAIVQAAPFDVLVLDDSMPDIPGTLVGKSIRQLETFPLAYPRSRHVYYSAHAGIMSDALRAQCEPDAYIVKPGEPDELVAAVKQTVSDC